MRKLTLVVAIALMVVLASTGIAYANFGPHGGYDQDTDACAGCHRAHTSFSTLGYSGYDGLTHNYALLVANAATMTEFCYACHGDAAPGASTNVQSGVFDGGPTAAGAPNNTTTFYPSNSDALGTLNGGGFDRIGGPVGTGTAIQSSHMMDPDTVANPALANVLVKWGNADLTPMTRFTCTDCHDPHGSSNYRLLKDNVGGAKVNYVESMEEGFPAGGFQAHTPEPGYIPNYTDEYYKASSTGGGNQGLSKWCAGCHTSYNETDGWGGNVAGTYDYSANGNPFGDNSWAPTVGASQALTFHRHPMGVTLAQGQGAGRALQVEVIKDNGLPMALTSDPADYTSDGAWTDTSQMECLTCHRAHGSASTMGGWAVSRLNASGYPEMIAGGGAQENAGHGSPVAGNEQGTNPGFSESLLRFPDRGVCERCHNK